MAIPLWAATALKGTEVRDLVARVVVVTNAAVKAVVAVVVLAVVAVLAFVAAVAVMAVVLVAVVAVVAIAAIVAVMAVGSGRGNTRTISHMQIRQYKVEVAAMRRRRTITTCRT